MFSGSRTLFFGIEFKHGEFGDPRKVHLVGLVEFELFRQAATKAGFTRESGESTRQRWIHTDGGRFEFAPDTTSDLQLGCNLAGPVLRLTLTREAGGD